MIDLRPLINAENNAKIDIDRLLDSLTADKAMPDSAREHLLEGLSAAIREYRSAVHELKYARQINERADTDDDVVPTCADYY